MIVGAPATASVVSTISILLLWSYRVYVYGSGNYAPLPLHESLYGKARGKCTIIEIKSQEEVCNDDRRSGWEWVVIEKALTKNHECGSHN